MNRRLVLAVVLAALVGGGAGLYGDAFAAEHRHGGEHAHGDEHAHHENAGSPEHEGDEDQQAEPAAHEDNVAVEAVSALALATGAVLLVPLALVPLRRRALNEIILVAATLTAASAVIHFAVVSEHVEEWWAEGAFFAVAGAAQLIWSLFVITRPQRALFTAGIVGSVGLIATWIVSRTVGIPIGPEAGEPEAVGFIDAVSTAFEGVVAILLAALLLRGDSRPRDADTLVRPSWIVAAVAVPLTAGALLDLV